MGGYVAVIGIADKAKYFSFRGLTAISEYRKLPRSQPSAAASESASVQRRAVARHDMRHAPPRASIEESVERFSAAGMHHGFGGGNRHWVGAVAFSRERVRPVAAFVLYAHGEADDETSDQNHHPRSRRQPKPQGSRQRAAAFPSTPPRAIATTRSTTSASRAITATWCRTRATSGRGDILSVIPGHREAMQLAMMRNCASENR